MYYLLITVILGVVICGTYRCHKIYCPDDWEAVWTNQGNWTYKNAYNEEWKEIITVEIVYSKHRNKYKIRSNRTDYKEHWLYTEAVAKMNQFKTKT